MLRTRHTQNTEDVPDEQIYDDEETDEQSWNQATAKERIEEWMGQRIVNPLDAISEVVCKGRPARCTLNG